MHPEPAVPSPALVRVAVGTPLLPRGVQKLAGLFGLDLGCPAGFLEGVDAPFGPFRSYTFATP